MPVNADLEVLARLDRLEDAVRMCAMLHAHGRDVSRLRKTVGALEPAAAYLYKIVLELEADRAARLETRPLVGGEKRSA
jgi:hypothetical protein